MTDLLNYISTWPVFKWVLLVLVAGFIGQFGKMMAEAMIAKMRRRREAKQTELKTERPDADNIYAADSERPSQTTLSTEISDKKTLKALSKAGKKAAKNK